MRQTISALALIASAMPAAAKDRFETAADAMFCLTARAAINWSTVGDKRPANVTPEKWHETIGCAPVPAGYEVVPLREVDGAINGIIIGVRPVERWFPAGSVRRSEAR